MRRFPKLAVYLATFGSMTAVLSLIALIILDGGGHRGDGVRAVVAEQNIAAGTRISEDMVKVADVPEQLLLVGAYTDTQPVVGQVTAVAIGSGEQVTGAKIIGSDGTIWTFDLRPPSYSANVAPLEACRVPRPGRGFGPIDPIEQTLQHIRTSNTCNQPDASTAKATRSTWDTAHVIVQARGASITKACEPQCVPDDTTKVWIVEVHGTFVSPESAYGGAMVPDTMDAQQTPSTTPTAGTWFSIIPVFSYETG